MITPSLPFADIIQNFQDIGTKTGFTPPQFIAQCIAFLIVCGLLYKFAWQPVLTVLDQRRKVIEDSITNADLIKKKLADAETERLAIVHKANDQANAIIASAEKSAAIVTERRLREATGQAEDIIRKAHEAAVLDRDRLMIELKQNIGSLVIDATQKLAGRVLTPDDQTRLNTETVAQLGAQQN